MQNLKRVKQSRVSSCSLLNCFNYQVSRIQEKVEAFQHDRSHFWTSLIELGAASKKIRTFKTDGRKQAAEWKSFESASIVPLERGKPTKLRKGNELWSGIIAFPNEK